MRRLIVLLVVSALAAFALSGCKGSSGDTGPQGPAGPLTPSVTSTYPAQYDANVPIDTAIRIAFSKDMNPATVAAANITVTSAGVSIPGAVSYNAGAKTAYFDPTSALPAFSYITVSLSSGVTDTVGNALASYSWSFYTGGSFAPSRLYVASYSSNIGVFNNPVSAGTSSFPDRLISGPSTSFAFPAQIWLDSAADRLYVSNEMGNRITVYNNASTAAGDIAPSRIISGVSTSLSLPEGMWLDAAKDELYVASWFNDSILVFSQASTTAGNIVPSRVISGPSTSLDNPFGFWLDTANDRLYVSSGGTGTGSILVFNNARTATGDISPDRIISSPTASLITPRNLWLDTETDQLYVACADVDSINVYNNASTINGDVAPSRVISGANTGLNWPTSIWVDKTTNRLYIGNAHGNNVLVFDNVGTANGNISPIKQIPFYYAAGLWLDTSPGY